MSRMSRFRILLSKINLVIDFVSGVMEQDNRDKEEVDKS
jgi:hypothetical protein